MEGCVRFNELVLELKVVKKGLSNGTQRWALTLKGPSDRGHIICRCVNEHVLRRVVSAAATATHFKGKYHHFDKTSSVLMWALKLVEQELIKASSALLVKDERHDELSGKDVGGIQVGRQEHSNSSACRLHFCTRAALLLSQIAGACNGPPKFPC